jgi:hypothetical protein
MLPNTGTEKFVSCSSSQYVLFAFCCGVDLLGVCLPQLITVLFVVTVEVRPPCPGQSASPGGGDFPPEAGRGGEEVRCAQGASHETPNRQVRS